MKKWMVLFITIFSLACLTQGLATEIPVENPGIESVETPFFSVPDCQPAPDVSFKVQKISDTLIMLIASGLQEGETPFVYYISDGRTGGYDGNIVDDKTEFYSELNLEDWAKLDPSEDPHTETWDIRLKHMQGVECATIILP